MFIGDHYWLADDSRLWGSKSQTHITASDPDYVAWQAAYNLDPTRWPEDEAGAQTDAALQAIVGPLGMFVTLTDYSAAARLRVVEAGIKILSITPKVFNADMLSRTQANNAKQLMIADPLITALPWRMKDGSYVEVTAADVDLIFLSMGGFAEECFTTEEETAAAIVGGTITTRAEIDAAYAAIPQERDGVSERLRARKPKR